MNNKLLSRKLLIGILVGILTLVMGSCGSSGPDLTNVPNPTSLPTRTPQEDRISTATIAPRPTLTKTEPLDPTITWTPLPTIHPDNIDPFIDSMNNKCEFPCWGDIIPGTTSESEAKHVLSSFGTIIESTSIYFDYREKPAVIDLTFEDGLVSSINLPPELTQAYKLNNLLTHYGIPEDVKMEVIPETAEGTSWFFLAIFFPQEGFFAIYSGEGKIVDSKVNACFEDVSPDLYLVEANKYSLEQISAFLDPTLRNILESLESLTELNVKQFYDVFVQQKIQCLMTTVHAP